jgi:hypothetical protein
LRFNLASLATTIPTITARTTSARTTECLGLLTGVKVTQGCASRQSHRVSHAQANRPTTRTNHFFFQDPKQVDNVVREIRTFSWMNERRHCACLRNAARRSWSATENDARADARGSVCDGHQSSAPVSGRNGFPPEEGDALEGVSRL